MMQPFVETHIQPFDCFRRDLQNICGVFDVDHNGDNFQGYASSRTKGGLNFAFVGQSAKAIHRTTQNIKSDPGSHFFLVLQTGGTAHMIQDGSETLMSAGDMFLVDSTQPSSFHYQERPSQQVSLHLPRQETIQRFGRRIKGGMAISGADPLVQAMRAILSELLDGSTPTQGHVSEAFYGVLGAYLFNRNIGEVSRPHPDRQIVNRALHILSEHYADPNFSPLHLAKLTGVSLRKLQRAFGLIKTSPHKRLQDVRLNAACERLDRVSHHESNSIAAIAFDCGFRDLSTFYRTFKKRYGTAPGDRRALQ